MEKVLKSSARVPESLYVKRGADIQISKVIKEMLRPGYISVARQMGKTNLLQNAKKELENNNDIIIYLDLSSSKYEYSRQYFRFVIDTILEVQDELLYDVKNLIIERRKDTSTSASSEHDRELRMILKLIPQRLVLILDEVDTLAKATFSDEIFAQIRSIYFMRSTYSVLEKLTYILSGVIEPTKLIKNKDNSPFNIAEQIYLDDFTYEEFLIFIKKSQLPIEGIVAQEIYGWLGGNPRMTYEICSFLEDIYISNGSIRLDDVQSAIEKIYLIDFNSAPIDHIRDLVVNNSLVREAVKNVRNGNAITDELKDQLYLYGIIESKFKSDTLKIKNKVIDLALSKEWLIEVETKTKGFYEFGLEKISVGDYNEGIKYIVRYAESPDINDVQRSSAYFSISDAYSRMGDYATSNQYIEKAKFDKKKSSEQYYYSILIKAVNCFALKLHEESFSCLEEIILNSPRGANYYTACLNKAMFKLRIDFIENYNVSLKIFEEIIESIKTEQLSEGYINSITSLSNFRIAVINQRLNLNDNARKYYDCSLINAPVELLPVIFIGLFKTSVGEGKKNHVDNLFSSITNQNLKFQNAGVLSIEFTDIMLYQALYILFEFKRSEFDSLISYVISHYYNDSELVYKLLYRIGVQAQRDGVDTAVVKEILDLGLACEEIDDTYMSKLYQASAINLPDKSKDSNFILYVEKAFDHLKRVDNYINLSYHDMITFASAAILYRDKKLYNKAFEFIDFIASRLDETDEINIIGDVIITNYLKGGIQAAKGDIQNALVSFKKADGLSKNWNRDDAPLLTNKEELEYLILDTKKAIASYGTLIDAGLINLETTKHISLQSAKRVVAVSKKIQRNSIVEVRYTNGKKEVGKYKRFESAIAAGRCILVS